MSKPDTPDDIDIILELAFEKGWTMHELAKRTGLHYNTICDMKVMGRASEKTLNKLRKALDIYSPHENKS